MQRSGLDLRVPLEVRPILVPTHNAHLMDVVAMLKHQTYAVVAQVVKVQVNNPQGHARIVEHLCDLLAAYWENQIVGSLLALHNLKRPGQ
jgi:hypothetical protein